MYICKNKNAKIIKIYLFLPIDDDNKSRGCGILEFTTEEMAKKAVAEMDGIKFNGRKIFVQNDRRDDRDQKNDHSGDHDHSNKKGIFLFYFITCRKS